jgi:hypothetical protein
VSLRSGDKNRFNGFRHVNKPLKRFCCLQFDYTRLKPGANEKASMKRQKKIKSGKTIVATTLKSLGLDAVNPGVFDGEWRGSGKLLQSFSPNDGKLLGEVRTATPNDYERAMQRAFAAFEKWKTIPAPKRGEVIRQLGDALRAAKKDLGMLVTLEAGKIIAEGQGEVQEMIDICDFATGLSRQLYGLTIASERPNHRMMEQWHPLGVVGVITAFNFPVAVWAWNSALAAVCGDACVWKPSSLTPLCAIATTKIAEKICRANDVDPAIFTLLVGDNQTVGERLVADRRVPLNASAKPFSNSAATMPSSLRPAGISISPPVRFCLARWARRGSVARRRGASSCMKRFVTHS